MPNETLGASFSIDITSLKAGLAEANRMIRESESEFREAAAGMDDWANSEEGLTARQQTLNKQIDLQSKKVDALVKAKDEMISKMKAEGKSNEEIARAIDGTNKQIINESKQLDRLKGELDKTNKSLDNLEKESGGAAKGLDGLKTVGGVAVGAVAAVGAACVAAVGAFLGLAESTREYRNEMAQLAQNAKDSGADLDTVKNKLAEVSAVTGEADAAMEGMNMLMATGLDTSQIETASDALAGAATRFDGLKFEGLAEGLQETLATGVAVGPFAELIERTGGDLEAFNEGLAGCTSEAERQAYAMKFLTESGLVEANAEYKEMNADLYNAEKAQFALNDALAELGAIAEPIMTTLKVLATDLLSSITPFVSLIGEGLAGALNGTAGATDTLAQGLSGLITHLASTLVEMLPSVISTLGSVISTAIPSIVQGISSALPMVISAIVGFLPELLSLLSSQLPIILQAVISGISQIAIMLGQMLPTLIPLVIDAVINLAETLIDNIDLLIDAGISLILGLADGLIEAVPRLIDKIPVIINKLISAITSNLPKILAMGIELLVKLGAGLIVAIPKLLANIPQIIAAIIGGLKDGLSKIGEVGGDLIRGLWDGINDMGKWIKDKLAGFGEDVLDSIKGFFGIESPSKVMADVVGKNLALGIGEGFENNIGDVNDEITDAMNFEDANMTVNARGLKTNGSGARGGVVVNQYNTYSQAHSRYEIRKSEKNTAAAVKLAMMGV